MEDSLGWGDEDLVRKRLQNQHPTKTGEGNQFQNVLNQFRHVFCFDKD